MQNKQGKNFNNQTIQTSQTQSKIPTLIQKELKFYLNAFETDSKMRHYRKQESALKMLFKAYPHNNNLDEIIIKVASLNSLYGTNIFNIFAVAEHISRIKNIDERLKNGDENLVGEIAKSGLKNKNGKEIIFYSFATKFCSFHNDRDFAIYDSFVAKVLAYFQRKDKFSKHKFSAESPNNEGLKNYAIFKEVLLEFKKRYKLECNLKSLDLYLWQFGKTYFEKQSK